MTVTRQRLKECLHELELDHGIKVIHAAEVGSRAWGYHHDGSDIDVRYIYVQLPWERGIYDKLDTKRNTFDINGVAVDLQGFELRKAVQKLTGSDLTVAETIYSKRPIGHNGLGTLSRLASIQSHHHNPTTLFNAARDQATRHLHPNNGELSCKALLLSMRFMLIAMSMAEENFLELELPKLVDMFAHDYPWLPDVMASLIRDGRSRAPKQADVQNLRVLHATVRDLQQPPGGRVRDVVETQHSYSLLSKFVFDNRNLNALDLVI